MLVTNRNVQDLLRSFAQRTSRTDGVARAEVAKPAESTVVRKSDEVVLSQEAQEVHRALRALKETPEVREDLVADLRQRIQDGTYKVDSEEIAELLLSDENE